MGFGVAINIGFKWGGGGSDSPPTPTLFYKNKNNKIASYQC